MGRDSSLDRLPYVGAQIERNASPFETTRCRTSASSGPDGRRARCQHPRSRPNRYRITVLGDSDVMRRGCLPADPPHCTPYSGLSRNGQQGFRFPRWLASRLPLWRFATSEADVRRHHQLTPAAKPPDPVGRPRLWWLEARYSAAIGPQPGPSFIDVSSGFRPLRPVGGGRRWRTAAKELKRPQQGPEAPLLRCRIIRPLLLRDGSRSWHANRLLRNCLDARRGRHGEVIRLATPGSIARWRLKSCLPRSCPIRRRSGDSDAKHRLSRLSSIRTCASFTTSDASARRVILPRTAIQSTLVMEHLDGESFAHRLARGRLSTDQALDIASDIARGLAAVHRAGVVHRDLKPGNVMLTRQRAKLVDFGVARLRPIVSGVAPAPGTATVTAPGTIAGTLPYHGAGTAGRERRRLALRHLRIWSDALRDADGQASFPRDQRGRLVGSILERQPSKPSEQGDDVAPLLNRIVAKCLAKARMTDGNLPTISARRSSGCGKGRGHRTRSRRR